MQKQSSDPNSDVCKRLKHRFNINPGELMPILFDAYHPAKLGFKLMSIAEFVNADLPNNECWVSGPVVAIRNDLYDKFRDAIAKGNIK